MSEPLLVCSACSRHVAAEDRVCPFCGSDAPRIAAASAEAIRPMATLYGGPPQRMMMPAYGLPPQPARSSRVAVVIATVVPAAISIVSLLAAFGVLGVVRRKDGAPETSTALLWNGIAFGVLSLFVGIVGLRRNR